MRNRLIQMTLNTVWMWQKKNSEERKLEETAKITAQRTWKVTGLHVPPVDLEQVSPTLYIASLIFNDVYKVGETYSKSTGETCKPVTFHVS